MMWRSILPICRQAGRQLRVQPSRQFFGHNKRNLPIWYRKNVFDDYWDVHRHSWPSRLMQENFKMMEKMIEDVFPPGLARTRGREVNVKYSDRIYEVTVDVDQFKPEELNVRLSEGRLTITAKHEEKPDQHGFISREFSRQFVVPEDVDIESMESKFTENGYLVVKGNIKGAKESPERVIEIQHEKTEPKSGEEK